MHKLPSLHSLRLELYRTYNLTLTPPHPIYCLFQHQTLLNPRAQTWCCMIRVNTIGSTRKYRPYPQ
jgi:hypothetical protein